MSVGVRKREDEMKFRAVISIGVWWFLATVGLVGELPNDWAPKWEVGDWWIVQTYTRYTEPSSYPQPWSKSGRWRYEVKGIEKVNGQNCYVLELSAVMLRGDKLLQEYYYFRVNDLRAVRVYYPPERHIPPSEGRPSARDIKIDGGYAGMIHLPCFPLIKQGSKADSLATIPRKWGGIGWATQIVTQSGVEEFEEIFADFDSICSYFSRYGHRNLVEDTLIISQMRNEEAYFVLAEGGVNTLEQIWVPSLPYALFGRLYWPQKEEGTKQVSEFYWLVDYSGLHKENKK